MSHPSYFNSIRKTVLLAVFGVLAVASCLPGEGSGFGGGAAGAGSEDAFKVIRSNVQSGATWQLNRLIEIEFNHSVAPESVNLGSIQIFSNDSSIPPVTGSFEFKSGSENKVVIFRPVCPTNLDNNNGGLYPGGVEYSLVISSQHDFSGSVILDSNGQLLAEGLGRVFTTPLGTGPALFIDDAPTPPAFHPTNGVTFPTGLNLFTNADPTIAIAFDQSVDARATNVNLENIYILFSEDEGPGAIDFPATNLLPGSVSLVENCVVDGAVVAFTVAGIMPPGRALRLVVRKEFSDIGGSSNIDDLVWPDFDLPTLADYFGDETTDWANTEVVDEFQEDFADAVNLDFNAAYEMPLATVEDGYIEANFEFPGQYTEKDFYFDGSYQEISTDSQSFFQDSNNTLFTLQDGVLYCRNFTIESGSELRGRGFSPLVIYATGNVNISGTLNVSGNNALWPTGLNSPTRPEGGAGGECGGGTGGTSSQETTRETPRGMSGFGAFEITNGGGRGGETGYSQNQGIGSGDGEMAKNVSAGGGGGGFTRTPNEAMYWYRWTSDDKMPEIDVRGHLDHNLWRHLATNPFPEYPNGDFSDGADDYGTGFPDTFVPHVRHGAEEGIRGSSFNCFEGAWEVVHGVYGFEDMSVDMIAVMDSNPPYDLIEGEEADGHLGNVANLSSIWDKPWTDPASPQVFQEGDPGKGPDGGQGGLSIFRDDGDTSNDFFGRRVNTLGGVTPGELLIPWAGSGGGASGDMILYNRQGGGSAHVNDSVPDPNFPSGTIVKYRKGAPGGGGGGQIQIMAIGSIKIGANGLILAKGGNGISGESTGWTYGQINGSGGGSGGHIILHSATNLDLRDINLSDDGSTLFDEHKNYVMGINDDGDFGVISFEEDYGLEGNFAPSVYYHDVFRAHGGRRGCSASRLNKVLEYRTHTSPKMDGNDTWQLGRGGAGANGIIQIHVPNPADNILFAGYDPGGQHSNIYTDLQKYIREDEDWETSDPNPEKLERVLRLYGCPMPYSLVPFFSASSVMQSHWIDTGLALLREPGGLQNSYPDYSNDLLNILGFDPISGVISSASQMVLDLSALVSGSTNDVEIEANEVHISSASLVFANESQYLRQPQVLIGYDFRPDSTGLNGYLITAVSYDAAADVLELQTDPDNGSMEFAINPANPNWSLLPKFFQIRTDQIVNSLPSSATVVFSFQGADESLVDDNQPGSSTAWVSDLDTLKGHRFIRWRVEFNIDSRAATTLRANFNSTATTMKVDSSQEFPDEGRALVNSREIISYIVNDRANNELRGIERGLEDTDSNLNFTGWPVEVISNDPDSNGGVNLNSSKPRLEFFKIPFVW